VAKGEDFGEALNDLAKANCKEYAAIADGVEALVNGEDPFKVAFKVAAGLNDQVAAIHAFVE